MANILDLSMENFLGGIYMYLSELFLKTLNGDYSRKSVTNALEACNTEMVKRIGDFDDPGDLDKAFFVDVNTCSKTKPEFDELMDFWDAYADLDSLVPNDIKDELCILRTIFEIDGIYQYLLNKEMIKELTNKEVFYLDRISYLLRRIRGAEEIVFFTKTDTGMRVAYRTPLEDFDRFLSPFEYASVQNKIIHTMKNNGAVAAAGQCDEGVKLLKGYVINNGEWIECTNEELGKYCQIFSESGIECVKELRGFKYFRDVK